MSKTQQEIAAPQVRNKIFQNISLTFLSIVITAFSTFFIYVYQKELFSTNKATAIAFLTLLLLMLIIALIACIYFKVLLANLFTGLYAFLTFFMAFAIINIDKVKSYIFGKSAAITSTMLFLVFSIVMFLGLTIYIITHYKQNRLIVLAALNGVAYSITMMFTSTLRHNTRNVLSAGSFIMIASALICLLFCFIERDKRIVTTKWITYCATFTALSLVCKTMGGAISITSYIRLSIVYIPWVISGIVLGPVGGMISACLSDVIGQLIAPAGIGALNPLITLANTLFPLFPALMYRYSPLRQKWLNILIGLAISTIVCTLGLSTLGQWLQNTTDISFWGFLVANRLFQPIVIAINYMLIMALLPALKRAKLTNLSFINRPSDTMNSHR